MQPPLVVDPDAARKIHEEPEIFLRTCQEKHGPIFTVRVREDRRMTYVLDPHWIHALLTSRQVDFSPISRQSKIRFGLGTIVATNGGVRDLSDALLGALRGERLQDALERFDAALRNVPPLFPHSFDEERAATSVQEVVHRTLIPAMAFALFGRDLYDDRFVDDFLCYSSSVATRFTGSDPSLDPAGLDAEKALLERLGRVWARRESPVVRTFCETLLDRGPFSHEERLRALLMLLWGSMVNLVPTSVWLYADVFRDSSAVSELRVAEAREASALRRSAIKETLRLHSKPNIYREVIEDCTVERSDGAEIRLQGGDWVALFPRFLHHDPNVYPDPLRFKLRRFLAEDGGEGAVKFFKDGRRLRPPTMTFGLGRGRCPGDQLSLEVLDRLLADWLDVRFASWDVTFPEKHLPEAVRRTVSSTPPPSRDIRIELSRRPSCILR